MKRRDNTLDLTVESEDGTRAIGGYNLGTHNNFAAVFITEVLSTVGVGEWGDLEGKYIRLIIDDQERCLGIKHITEKRELIFDNVKNLAAGKAKKD